MSVADDIIDGVCCALCGCYFKHPEKDDIYEHGYPVACWDCWDSDVLYQKADEGIETF